MQEMFLIDKPLMEEMIKRIFKNSEKRVVKQLKKYIKKQSNPFKENFGKFIVDRETYVFLQNIYIMYLGFNEQIREGFGVSF